MSKPIEGVSEKIETCAKKEFLDKGYVDASLRTIAAEAGTTTGSIYSRYGGKEGLFSALVEPAAKEFTEIFVSVQEKFQKIEPEKQADYLDEYAENGMMLMLDYMYDHFEIFQLLVDGAYGTKFQNFVEHLVEIETLTKEDIQEIVSTGKLEWWEKKKAKEEAKKVIDDKEKELQKMYEKQLEDLKKDNDTEKKNDDKNDGDK